VVAEAATNHLFLLSEQIKASKDQLRNIRLQKHALVALIYNAAA
jgi:hypothetical protein